MIDVKDRPLAAILAAIYNAARIIRGVEPSAELGAQFASQQLTAVMRHLPPKARRK
jgi:hypothetical protein